MFNLVTYRLVAGNTAQSCFTKPANETDGQNVHIPDSIHSNTQSTTMCTLLQRIISTLNLNAMDFF